VVKGGVKKKISIKTKKEGGGKEMGHTGDTAVRKSERRGPHLCRERTEADPSGEGSAREEELKENSEARKENERDNRQNRFEP